VISDGIAGGRLRAARVLNAFAGFSVCEPSRRRICENIPAQTGSFSAVTVFGNSALRCNARAAPYSIGSADHAAKRSHRALFRSCAASAGEETNSAYYRSRLLRIIKYIPAAASRRRV